MENKGFTLIELVVAIAILGIIMLIAIPSVKYIQGNNRNSKYISYEKAVVAATKNYVDAYNEDLFGIDNTGCSFVTFEDLENKNIIEDVQLKNTTVNNIGSPKDYYYTYVAIRKTKNGNYNYEPHVCFRENNKVVYGNTCPQKIVNTCSLEDGSGPSFKINITPSPDDKNYYYIGDKVNVSFTISDSGVGLKEGQTLKYEWYRKSKIDDTETKIQSEKTLDFKNNNFASSVTRNIIVPSEIGNDIYDPTNYYLRVYGTIEDLDNNKTEVVRNGNGQKTLHYFVGALLIKMNANGGKMINPHGEKYKLNSNGDVVYSSDNKTVYAKIKYKSEDDLWNYNNESYLNVRRDNYRLISTDVWNTKKDGSGTKYDQTTKYKTSAFGINDSDLIKEDKTITLYLSWKPYLKPETPTINNSHDGLWTKNPFGIKVSTTTPSSKIGNWYYTYDRVTLKQFKTSANVNATGINSFTTANFVQERNQNVYVRVCSIYATDSVDSYNCSDYASSMIMIDKTPPKYISKRQYTGRSGGRNYNFWLATWKDDLSGLSTINNGNYSKIYYCYGTCSRACKTYAHGDNTYRGTVSGLEGIYLRKADIDDNFISGTNAGDEVKMETFRSCDDGDYTIRAEMHICDLVNNCTDKYVTWDFD